MEILKEKIKNFFQLEIRLRLRLRFTVTVTVHGYGSRLRFTVTVTVHGYGDDIKFFNNKTVYLIDNVNTIITHITKNIAKGFILNKDFTLEPCYVVKGQNKFAHRKNIKGSNTELTRKNI